MDSILARLLLVIAALAVAGCGRRADDADHRPPAPPATGASAPAPPVAAAADGSKATEASTVPAIHSKLALDPEGLRIVDTRSGSSRLLPFGTREASTVATLGALMGGGPVEQGEVDDCNASYARWPGGLGTWFTAGNFSGWAVPAESTGLATAAGVKPGSSRAELESAYSAIVFESSLGTEFTAGDLAGVLSSDAPDARITHLWSGTTCIAR